MSKFAILRTQKLKAVQSVQRSIKHAFRDQETPNADPEKAESNTHIGAQSAKEALEKIKALLPENRRKDAVLAIEYLITASPEAMQGKTEKQQNQYFEDSLDWLEKKHGSENVVYAGIHRDETTPHMYAYVVPLNRETGRLNAKEFLGGAKALNRMQTEFAQVVGKHHGLERGIEGSKAKHTTLKEFYGKVEEAGKGHLKISPDETRPQVLEKGLLKSKVETPEQVSDRINGTIAKHYQKEALQASRIAHEVERAKIATEHAEKARSVLRALTDGVNKPQLVGLMEQAEKHRQENKSKPQKREISKKPEKNRVKKDFDRG